MIPSTLSPPTACPSSLSLSIQAPEALIASSRLSLRSFQALNALSLFSPLSPQVPELDGAPGARRYDRGAVRGESDCVDHPGPTLSSRPSATATYITQEC